MKIEFCKYHGTGNDFILIDNRNGKVKLNKPQIYFLCDRHMGVGADGLIILNKKKGYDFYMLYYNSDGNQSTMCGNGGRCIVAFANSLKIIKNKAAFSAVDGAHKAELGITPNSELRTTNYIVKLQMKDVLVFTNPELRTPNYELRTLNSFFIDSGSPHYVRFVDNIKNFDVVNEGRKIRNSAKFRKEGINVDFVEIKKEHIYVRSYERGVEDETLSCGTGVVASAIAYALKTDKKISLVNIKTSGGDLAVEFNRNKDYFTNVRLNGPATFVFKGEIEI